MLMAPVETLSRSTGFMPRPLHRLRCACETCGAHVLVRSPVPLFAPHCANCGGDRLVKLSYEPAGGVTARPALVG